MNETVETMECPNHEGAFDCTPFCSVCEGEQEVTPRLMFRAVIAWDSPLGQDWRTLWKSPFMGTAAQAERVALDSLDAGDYPYGSSAYLIIQDMNGRDIISLKGTK